MIIDIEKHFLRIFHHPHIFPYFIFIIKYPLLFYNLTEKLKIYNLYDCLLLKTPDGIFACLLKVQYIVVKIYIDPIYRE